MEEYELIRRIRSGDSEAFRAFYEAHAGALYRLLLEKCGDRDLAKQMLKDVFSQAHARIRAGEDVAALYLEVLALLRLREDTAKAPPVQEAPPAQEAPPTPEPDNPPANAQPNPPARGPEKPAQDASLEELCRDAHAKLPAPITRRRKGNAPMALLAIVLVLLILWVLAGYLMSSGILPHSNLGYEWFNTHVYPFFK